ncbi:hypothetical protein [Rhodobacter capsulatus]|jgi:hypothetical protein|uniref:Conserved domain protein n=1 Tax=Rhodobacter capsulatus (strain ATCC BAA-309 / NBRC 16581 / SB1003) TaxID=272942 RepID=D5AQW9_RHOCB|nr:hypothetical protein [Rhodobacter capsulatus]YP_004934648.1 hypothetical protein RcapMu5 [Rhodobacter phage RcapMu]ADE84775.1 conserved domain protein [Rhodobacter capsulatus SB 1003]AER29928.1 hypothetical protein RcapMu5 [Rhodobacter phage RcapMu]ETD02245.1 hypothetical protein U714_06275 [Rhodobacter capsulatus DE442]ETD78328.1 hypothetical protein U717_06280 [Rhodobacter capsulatus R121]ETE54443.1 hypothetical protein U715_06270 [Rhodobacter capsulatus Y262]
MTNRATCRIIETLGSPTTDAAIGCLIGLGHHELADKLAAAEYDRDFWQRSLDKLPRNSELAGADDNDNADPFWAFKYKDVAAGDLAFSNLTAAQKEVNRLSAEVEEIRQQMILQLPLGTYEDHLGL